VRAARDVDVDQLALTIEHARTARHYADTHRREFIPDWYSWQRRFFRHGATHRERMILCGNRGGKTNSTGYEDALHLTGRYPDWWEGHRFDFPINAWLFGVDAKQVRDVLQKELLGDSSDALDSFINGWIHNDEIINDSIERSALKGAVNRVRIKHISGGYSTLTFFSYTQIQTGQSTLPVAGSSVDLVHGDEQPPDTLVGQLITRVITGNRGRGGLVVWSMTPELGLTDLVAQFMQKPATHQALIGPISWAECPHLTPKMQAEALASYPVHEREMRSKGIPLFGSGRIFRFNEDRFLIDPFDLNQKPWMKVIKAVDVGVAHPTGGAWLAYDPENTVTYLVRTYRSAGEAAAVHGAAMNAMWPNAPTVYPQDADTREKGSAQSLLPLYGFKTPILFTNPDPKDSNYVEPGIMAMQAAEEQGRFFGFRGQCDEFMEEIRTYHRDERGNIVAERDDVISAVRYGFQTIGRYGVALAERSNAWSGNLYPDLGLRTRSTNRQGRR
jgi:phage terminase large subunit-like protein